MASLNFTKMKLRGKNMKVSYDDLWKIYDV